MDLVKCGKNHYDQYLEVLSFIDEKSHKPLQLTLLCHSYKLQQSLTEFPETKTYLLENLNVILQFAKH